MIDPKLLAETEATLKDARFGYCAVNSQLYTKHVTALLAERQELLACAEALAKFKEWVHGYLDIKRVPADPGGPHSAEGCRIGDRMDLVFAELDGLRAEVAESLKEHHE